MKETLCIGALQAESGTKTNGYYTVPKTLHRIPVTIINGAKDGKIILITSGIHGGEYPGIQTAIELAQELNPAEVQGALIILHPVNTQAFLQRVAGVIPEDGENLNRVFPGTMGGTITHKTAFSITKDFQSIADFYIDLHGGDVNELVMPYVYYPGIAEETVSNQARECAYVTGCEYVVRSIATGGAFNSAAANGVPSLLIERGGSGLWSKEEVQAYKFDVLNILKKLEVRPGEPMLSNQKPKEITTAFYIDSEVDGCWYPAVKVGQTVSKGEYIGVIKDFFGKTLREYYAPEHVVVLYMTVTLGIESGTSLIALGQID